MQFHEKKILDLFDFTSFFAGTFLNFLAAVTLNVPKIPKIHLSNTIRYTFLDIIVGILMAKIFMEKLCYFHEKLRCQGMTSYYIIQTIDTLRRKCLPTCRYIRYTFSVKLQHS